LFLLGLGPHLLLSEDALLLRLRSGLLLTHLLPAAA
jgi:hypothetical protein